ncbi:MAG: putative baseplate assembly protein, partial [Candidatus Cybelea sp.]
ALAASPLANLRAIVETLALPPSVQPANALRLSRSVAQSYSPQSDIAPRLIAALKPAAAPTLYQAWQGIATPATGIEILAPRVKAALFAANYAGPASVTRGAPPSFTAPSISTAWQPSMIPTWSADDAGAVNTPPPAVALDATYEQIEIGTWVAIDRPAIDANGVVAAVRTRTYHLVTAANTTTMDTTTGFTAKVTLLTLEPQWLSDMSTAQAPPNLQTYIADPHALRGTVVYAQTEPLDVTDEPIDTDVEGSSIDLDVVYDGLEPGRWVIVSGTRTDIPNTSGVVANERVMIAAVAQGSQTPYSIPFPLASPPFASVAYTSGADAYGDRLVVGVLTDPLLLKSLAAPAVPNQQFADQVELATGTYADAYVPTPDELKGKFPAFAGLLVSPETNIAYPGGTIPDVDVNKGIFAWRISADKVHTILTLANSLAYTYDRSTITIYGNVADATNGQSVGEIMGNGDATKSFPAFTLGQSPLTYVSANTPAGISSTLTVQVNDLQWQEIDDFLEAAPSERCYIERQDDAQATIVTFGNGSFGARLPTGTANVKALYRYGMGSGGNVDAGQISQLVTHPLGAQGVVNPLPATGGADPDTVDRARVNVPISVMALDRLVSVQDYADFSLAYAGIGKASAVRLSDGRQQIVLVTIAGAEDIPIDTSSDLFANLLLSLQTFGDPHLPVKLVVRRARLIVMSATVGLAPDYIWEDVVPNVRAALLALFAFDARDLGQTAFLSEAVRAAQDVGGVAFVNVTTFDGVPENVTAAQLASLAKTLTLRQYVRAEQAQINAPAELVFMTPDIPDTLILTQAGQ